MPLFNATQTSNWLADHLGVDREQIDVPWACPPPSSRPASNLLPSSAYAPAEPAVTAEARPDCVRMKVTTFSGYDSTNAQVLLKTSSSLQPLWLIVLHGVWP